MRSAPHEMATKTRIIDNATINFLAEMMRQLFWYQGREGISNSCDTEPIL